MNSIAWFVAIPLGVAFLLPLVAKLPKTLSDTLAVAATAALTGLALFGLGQEATLCVGGWTPVNDVAIGIHMRLDGLSALLLLVIAVISLAAVVYSVSYMEHYTDKARYYALFLLMVAGMNGVVLSGDMFNLFVFLEVSAIASYALVAFGTGAEELEASYKYQVMGAVGSALILLGIAILYSLSGTLNMVDMSAQLGESGQTATILFAAVLFVVGFGLKAAQVPFHAWLPDAHSSAPAPISAMLSGVLIKALGVYAMMRVFFTVVGLSKELSVVLMALGALSMIVGVILAIGQSDLKRLLAYSSISQVGYVTLGLGIGAAALLAGQPEVASLAILGALFHLVNHATFKSLLFLSAGAIEHGTGTRNLEEMEGLRHSMPVTSFTTLIGSFAIAGVPPFNGFWSKLIIIVAAVQAGFYGLAAAAALVAVLTLATFLKVQGRVFFGRPASGSGQVHEAPAPMCMSMIVLAVLCVGLGALLLDPLRPLVLEPAVKVLQQGIMR